MEEQRLVRKKQKASGNNDVLVTVCTDLAALYNSECKYSQAIKEYKTACEIYKNQGKKLLYGRTNRGIGEVYMAQQKFELAIKYFNIYLDVAQKENNICEQQRALAQLGHVYLTWHLEIGEEKDEQLLNNAFENFIKSMQKCEILSDSTEKQDMLARLFSNLGLVKEGLKEPETALDLYNKSLRICLKYDLYEQLYRGYMSIAALFDKQAKYKETIKNYNSAIETAKKLSTNRVELICGALLAKAEILIKLVDFHGAKQVLRKAYKFKTPNEHDKKSIERNLRVVAGMCKLEDDLIICKDDKERKKIYEKMGDGACDLKIYTKAIEYYKKMLEAAQAIGVSDKELGECYYCIGETYKDLRNYKEAVNYLEKEYELCRESLKSALNTLCLIADIKEEASDNVETIKKVYERALSDCKKKGIVKEEKRITFRYIGFLRRSDCHKDVFRLEQHLGVLSNKEDGDSSSSMSEQESGDSDSKVHIGKDITLSDITDLSEQSDNEIPNQLSIKSARRRKQFTVKFKKNLNGEWPLHVSCIKGNLKMVKHWLGVGHPVNVRDNAGWMPLHEASLHGHLEIVELLLDHKAAINDRGGSECNGITPLHDAASNGHLDVVRLLLNRGASSFVKTDDGSTPLHYLKIWHRNTEVNLSDTKKQLYEDLVKRLSEALDKAAAAANIVDSDQSVKHNVSPKECSTIGLLRRSVEVDSDGKNSEDEAEISNSSVQSPKDFAYKMEHNAANVYQSVMETLRKKNIADQNRKSPVVLRKTPLINEQNFVDMDDWLEEDIPTAKNKKRKTHYSNELISRSNSIGSVDISKRLSDERENTSKELNWWENRTMQCSSPYKRRSSGESYESFTNSRSKRRMQSTLLDSGFSCSKEKTACPSLRLRDQSQLKATGRNLLETSVYDSTANISQEVTELCKQQHSYNPTLFVDVEIERKVFRVPVLLNQIRMKSIKWLSEEAAQRYASKEYMRPTLELETSSGAVLADDDLITLLFPMGCTQSEKVIGKVVEWSLPPLIDRYKETCAHMNVEENIDLSNLIQSLSVKLNLMNQGILAEQLCPLFKAINHQKTLRELNLSGNFLNCNAFALLFNSLTTLPNIKILNISCTGLQIADFSLLANTIVRHNTVFVNLSHLDISDNLGLSRNCLEDLAVITNTINLTYLNISNIGLESIMINSLNNVPCLRFLKYLDISNNHLEPESLKKMISWTDAKVLKELNVSNNSTSRGCLKYIIEGFEGNKDIALEAISLARCSVSDLELFEFLLLAPHTTSFYLPYNLEITSVSLKRLLGRENVRRLELFGCTNIWKNFQQDERGWSVSLSQEAEKVIFNISDGNRYLYDSLEHIFKQKYPNCKVEVLDDDFLSITLINER